MSPPAARKTKSISLSLLFTKNFDTRTRILTHTRTTHSHAHAHAPRRTQAGGLFVAATTRKNVSASHVLELLHRVARVIKDYCGVMNEDALRKNSILTYELLDEMLDYGYAQSTSTESLKVHVFNEPATPSSDGIGAGGGGKVGGLYELNQLDP